MKPVTRRTFVTTVPALVAAVPVTAGQALPTETRDPHCAWHAEWKAIIDEFLASRVDWEDDDPRQLRKLELQEQLCRVPAKTLDGVLAQAEFAASEAWGMVDGSFCPDDAVLMNNIVRTLRALSRRAV
ncbi:hypothetical protein [Ruegeria sp. HKCCD8929]|uniref:hypothetical protein n=1 Tax=Ruegeria sp. HKCCD8929 TaxID=2683006 RepID=UPI001488BAB7|nr:hypothetical protein [Ruegeria sp. HKCCD8929]